MKAMYIIFFTLMLTQGCKKDSLTDTELSKTYPVNIDFQSGFNNDSALIKINGVVVASVGSITTYLGPAASRRFTIGPGKYTLSTVLPNDTVITDTTFVQIEKELWIGANYARSQKKINYIFQYSPFPYYLM